MEIIIENCSSPGAHFSKNTNEVLLKIYEWISENSSLTLPFIYFRRRLESEKKINDNNARNIYPMLKNSGLVEYEPGGDLATNDFFTRRGLAYIKALETKGIIENSDYTKKQKEEASIQVDEILSTIVCDSIELLLKNKELNYSNSLKWYILFLSKYGKINKQEFALMVYIMSKNQGNWQQELTPIVEQYRKDDIEINVKVQVRNDQKIQRSTGEKTRLEEISYFTAYTYYSGLVLQAGLVRKVKDYYFVVEGKKEKIDYLVEV